MEINDLRELARLSPRTAEFDTNIRESRNWDINTRPKLALHTLLPPVHNFFLR
jgi:hypothetical protein